MGRMLSNRKVEAKPTFETRPVATISRQAAPVLGRPVSPLPQPLKVQLVDSQENNPLRKIAFYFALATIFTRFAIVPELLYYFTGSNTYILYLVAPVAILGCLVTGGLQRSLRSRATYFFLAFYAWTIIATPFSFWPGDSTHHVLSYGRTDLILLFLAGGLAVTWKEVRAVVTTIALAGIVTVLVSELFSKADNGRIALDLSFDGIISNANDLAAHLMLVLPFILFMIMKQGRSILIRIPLGIGILYGVWVILGTGSRGALVGLMAGAAFCLIRATPTQRLVFIVTVPIMAALLVPALPHTTKERLMMLFVEDTRPEGENEAGESSATRADLFKKSVLFTIEHPVVGVGPSQFSNFEGNWSKSQGLRGSWHETHCTYTQISSECGIPALLFFVAGMFIAWRLLSKTYKQALAQGNKEIANTCFCVMLAIVGYMVTATFLAMAYRFTFPALIGLAIAIHFAAQKQLAVGPKPVSKAPAFA